MNCLPLHHIGGLSIIFRSLLYGFKVVIVDKFDKDDCIRQIINHDITLISLVPTMLSRLLQTKEITKIQKFLRAVILSGSYCSAQLLKSAINENSDTAMRALYIYNEKLAKEYSKTLIQSKNQ